MKRPRIDVNLPELDHLLDQACEALRSQNDSAKIKSALHALADVLAASRNSEKARDVLPEPPKQEPVTPEKPKEKAAAMGATRPRHTKARGKSPWAHPELKHGCRCPECEFG